jgi:hypothetical protein
MHITIWYKSTGVNVLVMGGNFIKEYVVSYYIAKTITENLSNKGWNGTIYYIDGMVSAVILSRA